MLPQSEASGQELCSGRCSCSNTVTTLNRDSDSLYVLLTYDVSPMNERLEHKQLHLHIYFALNESTARVLLEIKAQTVADKKFTKISRE